MKPVTRLLGLLGALSLIAAVVSFLPARAEATDSTIYRIRNLAYNQCIAAPDRTLNVVLRILPCNSSTGFKRWYLDAYWVNGNIRMRNVDTQHCAEVNQGTAVPGELVDDWYCNLSEAEQWEPVPYVFGFTTYYQFRHKGTNLCLDTVGSEGSQLMQWPCEPWNSSQLWKVE